MVTQTQTPPDGVSTIGAIAVFFGFPEGSEQNAAMEETEIGGLVPVVDYLTDSGFEVVTKRRAVAQDFIDWVGGRRNLSEVDPVAVIWSAHGSNDGSLQTADGEPPRPTDLARVTVADTLRFALFSSCHTGVHAARWHEALDGRPTIVGWDGLAMFSDVVEFYGEGDSQGQQLQRIFRTYLLNPALDSVVAA